MLAWTIGTQGKLQIKRTRIRDGISGRKAHEIIGGRHNVTTTGAN